MPGNPFQEPKTGAFGMNAIHDKPISNRGVFVMALFRILVIVLAGALVVGTTACAPVGGRGGDGIEGGD